MVLSKMNNHEHRTKQTYESYTFQPLMSFWYYQILLLAQYLERLPKAIMAALTVFFLLLSTLSYTNQQTLHLKSLTSIHLIVP